MQGVDGFIHQINTEYAQVYSQQLWRKALLCTALFFWPEARRRKPYRCTWPGLRQGRQWSRLACIQRGKAVLRVRPMGGGRAPAPIRELCRPRCATARQAAHCHPAGGRAKVMHSFCRTWGRTWMWQGARHGAGPWRQRKKPAARLECDPCRASKEAGLARFAACLAAALRIGGGAL